MNDIKLENLVIGYGQRGKSRKTLGKPFTLTIENRELTCLVGANGVGKSTLLRTIAGLQPPLSGTVTINGETIGSLSPDRRAKTVSIVLTRQPDNASLTVSEVVALGRMPYTNFWGTLTEEDHRHVEEAMRLTGVLHLAQKKLAHLSDGERQKVMIARAIAQQTPVILLDEPTAFLDYPSKQSVFNLLASLAHDNHKTILLTTHDLELASRYADRLCLFTPDTFCIGNPEDITKSSPFKQFIKKT